MLVLMGIDETMIADLLLVSYNIITVIDVRALIRYSAAPSDAANEHEPVDAGCVGLVPAPGEPVRLDQGTHSWSS
jgi:hypothetical protein